MKSKIKLGRRRPSTERLLRLAYDFPDDVEQVSMSVFRTTEW